MHGRDAEAKNDQYCSGVAHDWAPIHAYCAVLIDLTAIPVEDRTRWKGRAATAERPILAAAAASRVGVKSRAAMTGCSRRPFTDSTGFSPLAIDGAF
jgi:hypothetical protein